MIQWDHEAVNGMVADWMNQHAARLGVIAGDYLGGGEPIITGASVEDMTATIVGPDDSLVREYGTALLAPQPWGIPALMEAAQ